MKGVLESDSWRLPILSDPVGIIWGNSFERQRATANPDTWGINIENGGEGICR